VGGLLSRVSWNDHAREVCDSQSQRPFRVRAHFRWAGDSRAGAHDRGYARTIPAGIGQTVCAGLQAWGRMLLKCRSFCYRPAALALFLTDGRSRQVGDPGLSS
jgi:hypothetical protein